jgi:hypothetical protein
MSSSAISKSIKKNYFHTSSKLTRLQRKYCHCLMKVRPKIGKSIPNENPKTGKIMNHYGVCYGSIRRKMGLNKSNKKKKKFMFLLNPQSANCIMNYNYYAYTHSEIIAMAKEYKIPTSYTTKEGERKNYKKTTLFNKIVNSYLDKKGLLKSKSKPKSKSKSKSKPKSKSKSKPKPKSKSKSKPKPKSKYKSKPKPKSKYKSKPKPKKN